MRIAFTTVLLAAALPSQTFREVLPTAFDTPLPGGIRAVLDIDGDGDNDLLVDSGPSASGMHSYLNEGDGTFVYAAYSPDNLLGTVRRGAIGDIDGDGNTEFVAGRHAYRNLGNNTFALLATISGTGNSASALLDRDGDGDLDVVVGGSPMRLFDNNGSGQFTQVAGAFNGTTGFSIAVADVDGDGDRDIVSAAGFLSPLSVIFWRNVGGAFTAQPLPAPSPSAIVSGLLLADFDGNGELDVAGYGGTLTATPFILYQTAGTWSSQTIAGSTPIETLLTADLCDWNADGLVDFVTADGPWLQTSPSQFTPTPFEDSLVGLIWARDLDNDGDCDLAVVEGGLVWNTPLGAVASERFPVLGEITDVFASRHQTGSDPQLELLLANTGNLGYGTDAANDPFAHGRTLRVDPTSLSPFAIHDATFVETGTPADPPEIVGCGTAANVAAQWQGGSYVTIPPPSAVAASSVEAADLDGVPGDELLFGGPAHSGPLILTRAPGGWNDVSPSLPAVLPSFAPTFEQLLVADMDGDGSPDIVHEHRVLEASGTTWTVSANLAPLMPATGQDVIDIDRNGDGLRDLFVISPTGCTWLENTATGFVDQSATILPAGLGSVLEVSRGDVDGDGDEDLLVVATQSSVLRNDEGTFVLVADVAPPGRLIDANDDDCADVIVGDRIFFNERNLLTASHFASPGLDWRFELTTWRNGSSVQAAWIGIGFVKTFVYIPGSGQLFLDPAFADVQLTTLLSGTAERTLTIPASASVIGIELIAQAITYDGNALQLSNSLRSWVR